MKHKKRVRVYEPELDAVECVQIGLNTAEKKLYYEDTGDLVKDLDVAFKVSLPDVIGEIDYYFEREYAAREFVEVHELIFAR